MKNKNVDFFSESYALHNGKDGAARNYRLSNKHAHSTR